MHPTDRSAYASRKIIRSNKDLIRSSSRKRRPGQGRSVVLFVATVTRIRCPRKKILSWSPADRPTDRFPLPSQGHRPPPLLSLGRCPEHVDMKTGHTTRYSPHFPPRGGTPLGGRGGTQSERGKVCCTAEWVPSPPLPDFRLY